MAEKAKATWSFVSVEKMSEYLAEVGKMLTHAQQIRMHPFAAGMAGVMFIRNALSLMGGDPAWWQHAIDPTTDINELFESFQVPGGAAVARTVTLPAVAAVSAIGRRAGGTLPAPSAKNLWNIRLTIRGYTDGELTVDLTNTPADDIRRKLGEVVETMTSELKG